jgi:hypothetical protein
MKMLNLKDFEVWVYCMERGHDPSKGGQDTSVDRLAAVSQTVGSFFWTHTFACIEHNYSFMHNFDKFTATKMAHLILESLQMSGCTIVRSHK